MQWSSRTWCCVHGMLADISGDTKHYKMIDRNAGMFAFWGCSCPHSARSAIVTALGSLKASAELQSSCSSTSASCMAIVECERKRVEWSASLTVLLKKYIHNPAVQSGQWRHELSGRQWKLAVFGFGKQAHKTAALYETRQQNAQTGSLYSAQYAVDGFKIWLLSQFIDKKNNAAGHSVPLG